MTRGVPFQNGRPKTGGRKRGTPNNRTLLLAERLEELNCDPIAVMAEICNDADAETKHRLEAAKELAQYLYPKCKAIELPGQNGGVQHRIVVEYADAREPKGVQTKARQAC